MASRANPMRLGRVAERQVRDFLAVASQFRLGELPTEQVHPLTADLSRLAAENPSGALRLLHRVDAAALETLDRHLPGITGLARAVHRTLRAGRRVHLTGCGSTGRLALACEAIWRGVETGDGLRDRVTSFMAGGDAALVRAVEGFEDFPEHGARQLEGAGFRDGDLLIAASEGGETPFVIGAATRAAELSANPPWFLYCNPDAVLARTAERSARILAHPGITKLSLPAGPMALSGSTRLQASTVLMAAIGTALLDHARPGRIRARFATLATLWRGLDTSFLAGFTVAEARIYAEGGCLDYVADPALAITLLTDTTERAPTFSFPPFEHARDAAIRTAPCRLAIPEARDAAMAWRMVLGREPRALEWPELRGRASLRHLLGYDFSGAGDETPSPALPFRDRHAFSVSAPPGGLEFRLGALAHRIPLPGADPLAVHLVLKMMLNAHSTLVMGRLGRFDGNLMTWVKPSNHKLVDRTIRYAGLLLLREGVEVPYESLARACFAMRDRIPGDQSLVHAIVNHYKSARSGRRRPRAARRNNAGIPHG